MIAKQFSLGLATLVALLQSFTVTAEPGLVRTANATLQVGLDAANGSLRELLQPADGFNQIADNPTALGLWQITVRDGDSVRELSAEQSPPPVVEQPTGERPGLRLVWDRVPAGPRSLRVEVFVRLEPQETALSRWELSVTKPSNLRVEEIRFPRVPSLRPRPDEVLAVPRQLGVMARNPRVLTQPRPGSGARLNWRSPHGTDLSFPCLAFYQQDGAGFYAACDDSLGYLKTFSVWGDGQDQMHFEIVHEPEQAAVGQTYFCLPFTVVLGAFRGDWTTAAEIYRESPTAKVFAKQGERRLQLAPDWLAGTGLWLWNRGRSSQVLDPAIALRKRVKAPVSVLWHWWHNCPYDAGFPEYLPPREGAAPFSAALAAARRHDVHAILYMNQRLWGTTTQSWLDEGAEAFSVRGKDGNVAIESYNTYMKAPCAPMCIGTSFWREKYAGIAEEVLTRLKPDGIYMDQVGVLATCYDPRHGHIVGPGRYWTDGFAMLAADIRDRTSARGPVALGGEYGGEPWIGQFDLTLGLCISADRMGASPAWEPIPFFQAVYHPSTIVFGNMAGLAHPPYDEKWPADKAPATQLTLLDRKFARQFYLEHARTFVWGMQPMLANFVPTQLTERPEELDYVARLVRVRMQTLKYLLHGVWLRPPPLDVPQQEMDVVTVGTYTPLRASKRMFPVALAGAWRAPNGDVAIALASSSQEPLALTLPVDANAYGLPGRCPVYRTDERGRHRLGEWDRKNPLLRVELPPRGLLVLELSASESGQQKQTGPTRFRGPG
ncbi:MAG TPA: DUF6259 domain-containing protein [Verrucomicrobiae bacterium]